MLSLKRPATPYLQTFKTFKQCYMKINLYQPITAVSVNTCDLYLQKCAMQIDCCPCFYLKSAATGKICWKSIFVCKTTN